MLKCRIYMQKIRLISICLIICLFFLISAPYCPAVEITDQLGRRVNVPDNPQRIVSLAPSITEVVFALGRQNLLKGVTRFSDFPPQAGRLPQVGSYVHLDLEKIVALQPDLCIAVKDGNPLPVIKRLDALNIPVYAVDPRNIESVMTSIAAIGQLLQAEKQAQALVQDMRGRIRRVQGLVAQVKQRPAVFFQIGISPIVAVGTQTFIHELINMAGGINLTAGPIAYPRFAREQVLTLAPEIFIITSMARGETFKRVKAQWQQWQDLPAVRNDKIVLVDSDLFDRASPRLVDGLELLARIIHPKLFE